MMMLWRFDCGNVALSHHTNNAFYFNYDYDPFQTFFKCVTEKTRSCWVLDEKFDTTD